MLVQELAHLEEVIDLQAAMMAYIHDFWLFAFGALAALPLLLFIGKVRTPQRAEGAGQAVLGE